MSINGLSIFELLKYLARIIKQLRLHDKSFPITYLLYCFHKPNTTWVVEIEIVPIYHTSEHNLRHVYFAIIADYLELVKSLPGVTISSIRNLSTEFKIDIS